jgi:uncharacterized protein (TIGR03067 family)
VLEAMVTSNLKAAMGILVAACLIGGGTAVVLGRPPETPKKVAPVPEQAGAKEAAVKAMRERLQGTWKCVALHMGGVKSERDLVCAIKEGTWETKLDGRVYQSGTFKLVDLDASPKHIDWVITSDAVEEGNRGKTFHGIFMLDGDSLCGVNSDAATSPRPHVFFTEPNDGCYAAMYQRVDPKKDR